MRFSGALRIFSAALPLTGAAAIGQSTTKIVVHKPMTRTGFSAISSPAIAAAGYALVADYTARGLYEGPSAGAQGLLQNLRTSGYTARAAAEFSHIDFHTRQLDPDTGIATPPFPTSTWQPAGPDALYILTFKGYPTPGWLLDLQSRNVRLLEFLPPATYLVRGGVSVVPALRTQTAYVRSVFLVTPTMKKVLYTSDTSPTHQPTHINAVEPNQSESIKPYLDSVSQVPVTARRGSDGKVTYNATLSDVDANTLPNFWNVYSISPMAPSKPSSERQGILAIKPTGNGASVPDASEVYTVQLVDRGITDFSNTTVAMIDTGLDQGYRSGPNVHPDFASGVLIGTTAFDYLGEPYAYEDVNHHGTISASVITGWPPGRQRTDAQGYQYSLGLAPTVGLVVDRSFYCASSPADLPAAYGRIQPYSPNIVNMSLNDTDAFSCFYTQASYDVDDKTRANSWLYTISAGNTPDAPLPCTDLVRSPGTAKNALTVGATHNYTLFWTASTNRENTCAWSDFPAVQDARDIPSFSGHKHATSLVKPDLVAPATRVTGPVGRSALCLGLARDVFCNPMVADYGESLIYGYSAGTSFASAAAAGAAAVVRKWYRNKHPGLDPSPAMTKAILINGARDIAGNRVLKEDFSLLTSIVHIPDDYQGWGMLNLNWLFGPQRNYFVDQTVLLGQGQLLDVVLTITDGSQQTRITLVWTDGGQHSIHDREQPRCGRVRGSSTVHRGEPVLVWQ